jgi:hypothetical protein
LPDRIGDRDEDDRDGAHLQGERRQCRCGGGDDQVRLKFNELLRQRPGQGQIAAIPAIVDAQIATLGPSELPERLLECRAALAILGIVLGERHEHADARHAFALLRARGERPHGRHRAAEKANELASPHIRTQAQGPALYWLKRVLR